MPELGFDGPFLLIVHRKLSFFSVLRYKASRENTCSRFPLTSLGSIVCHISLLVSENSLRSFAITMRSRGSHTFSVNIFQTKFEKKMPELGFEPKSKAPQAFRISKLPHSGM